MNKKFLIAGLALLTAGWVYLPYTGGVNVQMLGVVPIPMIVILCLFGSGSTLVGIYFIETVYGKKVK